MASNNNCPDACFPCIPHTGESMSQLEELSMVDWNENDFNELIHEGLVIEGKTSSLFNNNNDEQIKMDNKNTKYNEKCNLDYVSGDVSSSSTSGDFVDDISDMPQAEAESTLEAELVQHDSIHDDIKCEIKVLEIISSSDVKNTQAAAEEVIDPLSDSVISSTLLNAKSQDEILSISDCENKDMNHQKLNERNEVMRNESSTDKDITSPRNKVPSQINSKKLSKQESWREVFDEYDTDSSGSISFLELEKGLKNDIASIRRLGLPSRVSDGTANIRKVLKFFNVTEESDDITWDDFCGALELRDKRRKEVLLKGARQPLSNRMDR